MADIQHISDAQKKIQGGDRYIKNVPDTKPIKRLWPAPADLGDSGRQFHSRIGKILVKAKVLTELDRYTWFTLCDLVDNLAKVSKILEVEGFTCGFAEKTKKHPAATLYNELLKQF